MTNEGSVLLAYGYTRGYEPFRAFVRDYLVGKGLRMDGQEILITNGFRQAAGLVVETLVSPGDAVAVEAPTYNGFLGILRARGARALPVDCDGEGVRLADLARALDAGARLVYLIPTYHNPTGRNMSLQRRQEVLALCRARGVPLLEDGFNEELRFRGECHPAIKALAGSEDVIYAGSFSKVLFPGLRVGWVAAPAALTRYLVHEKYNQDIHTPPLLQAALRQYCLDGSLDRHIKRVRGLYRERLDALYDALERRFSGRAKWERWRAASPPGWSSPRGSTCAKAWPARGTAACSTRRATPSIRTAAAAPACGWAFAPGAGADRPRHRHPVRLHQLSGG